jgi:hypothetical protein
MDRLEAEITRLCTEVGLVAKRAARPCPVPWEPRGAVPGQVAEDLGLEAGKSLKYEQDAKSGNFLFRVTRNHEKAGEAAAASASMSVAEASGRGRSCCEGKSATRWWKRSRMV